MMKVRLLLSVLYYYILLLYFNLYYFVYLILYEDVSYSKIARTMIKQVNEFLVERTREIQENAISEEKEDDKLSSK